ncbi:MAG: LPS-assembly protein LptD [Cyanobacteriota bacterium]|nr:LPS-assembly protein LptD [Cyanobacteriota bacterium]
MALPENHRRMQRLRLPRRLRWALLAVALPAAALAPSLLPIALTGRSFLALALANPPSALLAQTPPAASGNPAGQPPGAAASSGGENGLVTIESDQQLADNRTGIVTATGNVRITDPQRGLVATARQAQYFSREGRLVLSGDVEVVDAEGQRIRAERLVYRLDSERLQAEPGAGRQVVSRLRLQSSPGQAGRPGQP